MNSEILKTMKLLTAVLVCALCSLPALAADKSRELRMLEAAENVEFLSQKIAKSYFYKQQGVRSDRAGEDLKRSLVLLEKDLIIIQNGIKKKDKEENNIAIFLDYTMGELKGLLLKPYSTENGALIIDYSESLLEGAEVIAQKHMHKKDAEEGMLVSVEHLLFLLERVNKLYIVYQAGFKDYNNVTQLQQAVQDFEIGLAKVNTYSKYSEDALEARNKVNEFWPVAKEFFVDIQKGSLPVIVLASVEKLEKELMILEEFHHKKASRNK
ncbi:MAG: hypothetical protein D3910_26215 [Candidatus Electrothrix sp. ATG2]|nr:hypothetical protein [Candidatus Electrothrix sp. ATG2]